MKKPTPEKFKEYQANRRKKYQGNAESRARILAQNKKSRDAAGDKYNAARRAKWAADPEYKERLLAPRRGRCQRDSQLKVHYGIGLGEYHAILSQQGGVCGICREPPTETLCVDHCHSTGRIRGLLCRKCNTGLGCFKDDKVLFLKAMTYLETFHVD